MPDRSYCIISPVRDEAPYARRTLDAVLGQTVPPTRWVIVDDGSTDETPAILAEYAAKHPCITVVRRETQRGGRRVGPGVIEAFYAGYDTIDPHDYQYVCKLDLDLDLPPRYFETLIERMEADPRLGTNSGKSCVAGDDNPGKTFDGTLISEGHGDEMSEGMTKFYRRSCFEQIGGFVRQVMWDGIDCHRCRMLGWKACSYDEPGLRFIHLRPMGTSHKSVHTGRRRHGFGQWFMGTGPVYLTASALRHVPKRPVLTGAAAMWWGYVHSMLTRQPRYDDAEFRAFLRRYQWASLLKGKAAATATIEAQQAGAWNPPPEAGHDDAVLNACRETPTPIT